MHTQKKLIIILLFFIFLGVSGRINSFAQVPSPSQIERSQEILEKERAIREKIEEEKVFIKKIVIEGVTLLGEDQIKEIISPFQKGWLSKKDIQEILELIKKAYIQKGYTEQIFKISHQIKKKHLIIKVEESIPEKTP